MNVMTTALAAASMLMASLCRAEDSTFTIDPPAAPLSCLTSGQAGKAPGYPAGQTSSAVVRVRLTFANGSEAPVATITFNDGGEPFAKAVLDHLSAYRLPCLAPGKSLTAVQEFQFVMKAADDAMSSDVRYADEAKFLPDGCSVEGFGRPSPSYPRRAFAQPPAPGTVLALITFKSPAQAPDVKILFDGGERLLADTVVEYAAGYRLLCPRPIDEPVIARQEFRFLLDGVESSRLKEQLTLQQLLGAVKDLDRYKVRFDLTTMDCPFKIRFAPFQPYAVNAVQADLRAHPGRREFVEWLRKVELNIPKRLMRTAIGEPTDVAVPCALLDLT